MSDALNPNFLAYAASRGMTADEVMEADEQEYPGGKMIGFILWIAEMQRQFYEVSPQSFFSNCDRITDFPAWERYLQEQGAKEATDE